MHTPQLAPIRGLFVADQATVIPFRNAAQCAEGQLRLRSRVGVCDGARGDADPGKLPRVEGPAAGGGDARRCVQIKVPFQGGVHSLSRSRQSTC